MRHFVGFVVVWTALSCNQASFDTTQGSKKQVSAPQPAQPRTTATQAPTTPQVLIPQPPALAIPPINIMIGGAKNYHIGDGEMQDSSCKVNMWFNWLKGNRYIFEFDVLQNNTPTTISIDKVCGTESGYENYNLATLTGPPPMAPVVVQIPGGASRLQFPQTVNLPLGHYYLTVESRQNPDRDNDRDDFIVGSVHIVVPTGYGLREGKVSAGN